MNQQKGRLVLLLPSLLLWCTRVAVAADPEPAAMPVPPPGGSILSLAVPLLAVAFALVALWWILRRGSGRNGAMGPVRIVQVLAVGPRERVVIVDHDSRRFMLGVTPSAISMLADLDGKDAAKNPPSATSPIARTFD